MVVKMQKPKLSPIDVEKILVDIVRKNPEDELLYELLKYELGISNINGSNKEKVLTTLKKNATKYDLTDKDVEKIFYWVTHPVRDIRQIILTKTIEELLKDDKFHDKIYEMLCELTGKEGVELIFKWVKDGIMTLEQAIFTIVYPLSEIY